MVMITQIIKSIKTGRPEAVKPRPYYTFEGKERFDLTRNVFLSPYSGYYIRSAKRDILFREFNRWVPPYQKAKDILYRRFKK